MDVFPNISTEFGDTDGDGIGDNEDNCIQVANVDQADFDNDHQGDACDTDDDNDGLSDVNEAALGSNPHNPDTDGDGVRDGSDNCLLAQNADQIDSDGDGQGNACDVDDDNDGILDAIDKCSLVSSLDQTDSNGDGIGDVCTNDDDNDDIPDTADNCRTVANADQLDTDHDGLGDAWDPDDDNDGLSDIEGTTPGVDNLITNPLSADTDGDGISDRLDNCRITSNADQVSNGDTDGEGDACDCNPSDPNIRSDDAVFVASSGSDTHTGARNDPVRTISRGIALAQEAGKTKVYIVGGIYNESVTMTNGVSVFGGFSLSSNGASCNKNLYDGVREVNTVTIISDSSPVINFHNLTLPTELEGVVIRSSSSTVNANLVSITSDAPAASNNITIDDNYIIAPDISGGDVTAVAVLNASPLLINNLIDAGNSQESTAIELMDAPAPKMIHNTIRGGGSDSSSIVLKSRGSVPVLLNNILFTTAGISQIVLDIEDPHPSSSIVVRNNLVFGEQGTSPDAPKLYRDLSPTLRSFNLVSQLNSADGSSAGGNFDGNIRFTSNGIDTGTILSRTALFVDETRNNYRLVGGSLAVDAALNPASVTGQQVLRDRDFNLRPSGIASDLGAFER
ncbi:MAG: thrombospondin type 3 repeat-containing protein [Deltaproteobacteria bacterium]|nr:MAG: thrombospondin type 3 repeat-containing protein [Deltaproteobacteria bacterium]